MIDYLAGLMEDASDFSFSGAKACYGIVLSHMEQDHCTWDDANQLDRHRRCHAQRHTSENENMKKDKNFDSCPVKPCKFFQQGTCEHEDSHFTKGVYYTHQCAKCKGAHKTRNCTDKKTKNG